jgi:hypothetical protein
MHRPHEDTRENYNADSIRRGAEVAIKCGVINASCPRGSLDGGLHRKGQIHLHEVFR